MDEPTPDGEAPLELPQIERLQVVAVEPGDVVIATVPEVVDPAEMKGVIDDLRARFPDNEVLAVFGFELSAMRPVRIIGDGESFDDVLTRCAEANPGLFGRRQP